MTSPEGPRTPAQDKPAQPALRVITIHIPWNAATACVTGCALVVLSAGLAWVPGPVLRLLAASIGFTLVSGTMMWTFCCLFFPREVRGLLAVYIAWCRRSRVMRRWVQGSPPTPS